MKDPFATLDLVKISEAARILGVSIDTLRRWEKAGKITPVRTPGGTRLYSLYELQDINPAAIRYSLQVPSTKELFEKKEQEDDNLTVISNASERSQDSSLQKQTTESRDFSPVARNDKNTKPYLTISLISLLILLTAGSTLFINSFLDHPGGSGKEAKLHINPNVLAASTITAEGKFLEFNADTVITGNLAVEGEGIFGENLTAPNIIYDLVAGEGITISEGQTPTISSSSLDTLATVTARGSITTTGITLGDALNLGNLASDPLSAANGATYYNTGSNKFRCYINGSWKDCDTDTNSGGSMSSFTLAGTSGTSQTISDSNTLTIAAGTGITTTAEATDKVTVEATLGTDIDTSEIIDNTITSSDLNAALTFADGDFIDLASIIHDDSALQGLRLPQAASLTNLTSGEGFLAWDSDDNQVKAYNGSSWTSISGASTTLQEAYGNDTDGSDAIVALTADDDSLIFRNPATSGTDSGYILKLDQLATGAVDVLQISNAGTGTLLTLDSSGTGTSADGILIRQTSSGTITDAIDVTDETITNAINVGTNTIAGTTANIDLTYFDVAGTTGAVTIDPQTTGTYLDFTLETEWTNGTLINADYASATTQSGGNITGASFNFNSNLTGAADLDVTGINVQTPALTQSSAVTTNYIGYNISASGALTQDIAAGVINWRGVDLTTPALTETTGTITSYGINVSPGSAGAGAEFAGINIANSAGGGSTTEYGLVIGSGYDQDLRFVDTSIQLVSSGADGQFDFTDGSNTLCSIDDTGSVGNLSCTGTITGVGAVGYWTRTSTTLSPATANDIVSIATTNTTGADLAITNTGIYTGTGIVNITANSATSGDILTLSATALSTGTALTLAGPTSTGVTDHFVKISSDVGSASSLVNLNPDFSGSAVTGYGVYNLATDATGNGNTDYGYYGSLALTGNAGKIGTGIYSTVTSTSTTADTLYGVDILTDHNAASASGNKTLYGLRSQITNDGITDAAGTHNIYGGYFVATGNTGGTSTTYGIYTDANAADTSYGVYIDDGAGTTDYGVYQTAADDDNYFAGNVGLNDTTPTEGRLTLANASNTVPAFYLTETTATTLGNGANTTGVIDLQSTTLTTGNFLNIEVNALNSGKALNITNTTTLTSGTLVYAYTASTALTGTATTGNGLLGNFEWAPGSSTTATGDLFRIAIGTSGTTTGNLFNIVDTTSSIFSVSETALTTSLPSNFTSTGDVSIAYDINFTNPTANFIKSQAPINITAGESFNSTDLTLSTYNFGSVIVDSTVTTSAAASTKYAFYINTGDTTTTADTIYGLYSTNALSGAAAKIGYGIYSTVTSSSTTADTLYGGYFATTASGNAARTANYGVYSNPASSSTTADTLYGLYSNPVKTGITTTGTQSNYGGYFAPSSTAATTSTVTDVFGVFVSNTATHATNQGTVNSYGLYIDNGTSDANGTSTKYGIYVENLSSADNNYSAIFAGTNAKVGINVTAPTREFEISGEAIISSAENAATILDLDANSITGNTVLDISSTATSFTSGKMLQITKTGASGSSAFTGDIANITYSHTFNGGVGINHTGNVLDASRAVTLSAAQTHTISGALLAISDSNTISDAGGTLTFSADTASITRLCTISSGACTDSGNVLELENQFITATGPVLNLLSRQTASGGLSLFTIGAGASTTLAGTLTGENIDLNASYVSTNQSAVGINVLLDTASNTSGTVTYKGLVVSGGTLDQSTAGSTTFSGVDITTPAITQTAGTLIANGASITLGAGTTAGTINGALITPPSTTGASTTTNGINIGNITTSNGTDTGINIGTGWDNQISGNQFTVDGTGIVTVNLNSTSSNGVCHTNSGTGTTEVLLDCTGTITDYAEVYATTGQTEPGDLLVTTENPLVLDKSNTTYQTNMIGVVSTNPNDPIGQTFNPNQNPQPIGLAGRVPVKVSLENGPIKQGDLLTSSSIPGVAMKASRPGQVIGTALEDYDGTIRVSEDTLSQESHRLTDHVDYPVYHSDPSKWPPGVGKISVMARVSFADPTRVLANLILDEQGNLVIPKLKTSQLTLGTINITSSPSDNTNYLDVAATLKVQDQSLTDLKTQVATQSATLADLRLQIEQLASSSAANTSSVNTSGVGSDSPEVGLGLTPPDILLATGSATLADLKVTENLSSEKLLTALDATVSGTFKALSDVFLGTTTIAGDLTVDGTLSITGGNELSVIGSPQNTPGVENCAYTPGVECQGNGVLYLQNSPLAQGLDIFNGKVTIDKDGLFKAQTVLAQEYQVIAGQTSGSGTLAAGTFEVPVFADRVGQSSRILITPTTPTSLTLAVTEKVPGAGFVVSTTLPTPEALTFDWWIINEVAEINP